MTDFLLELRSEEIPARMQDKARDDLGRLFAAELAKAGLHAGAIVIFATPRRLALIARGLPDETAAVSDEIKGPRVGAPPQALEGFLRKTELTADQLTERDGVLYATIDKPGRATRDVLADAIPAIVRQFPWPKSMRWGAASLSTESPRWVRPLHGIVALFGDELVECEIAGVAGASPGKVGSGFPSGDATLKSSAATLGHRFHHPYQITIGSAGDYEAKLRACHVIVDQDQRRALIRDRAAALASDAGFDLIEDEGLVAENAGLTEWPVPLLGRFDEAFLDVPPEVIQLTARVNQKYFVCRDAGGRLANAFVCVANIDAADGGAAIAEGNRKVLAARLSDARFFYETDLKVPLESQAKKLGKIVFHEKLGTVADKVERVAKLARWLVEENIISPSPLRGEGQSRATPLDTAPLPASASPRHPLPGGERGNLADLAERAARLAKADLVTGMVGEFPELQGLMGGYYAAAQGEHPAVAAAVRDHYKPVGQGDDVPTDPVTVAVSLADKIDTLVGFFGINQGPTGSKDPYALRRAGIGVLQLLIDNNLRIDADYLSARAFHGKYVDQLVATNAWEDANKGVATDVMVFLVDRLKVQQREAGMRHDLIDAVVSLGEPDLVRLLVRVRALQVFVGTGDGANLLAGYKRAANILKKENWDSAPAKAGAQDGEALHDPGLLPSQEHGAAQKPLSYAPEPAETALIAALDAAEPAAAQAVAAEDFKAAMAALATLRAAVDAFFDNVTVNDADPARRTARLALLARVRDAVHGVADFSKIEG